MPIDPGTCEVAIETTEHFLSVLLSAGEAIGTPEMRELVDETVEIAEVQLDYLEVEDSPNQVLIGWVGILKQVDESRLAHMTGDDVPFIEAVGRGASYGDLLKAACRP